MKAKRCLSNLVLLLSLTSAASARGLDSTKAGDSLEACLIKNSHRRLKEGGIASGAPHGKDRIYSVEEEAWKDCRQGRIDEADPWQASEVQIMRAKVRMQLTWEQMNEHGA